MPTYDYQCLKCGSIFEIFHRISESPTSGCPSCGGISLKKVVSGFYLGGSDSLSKEDMKADLKENYGIEGVEMKTGNIKDWYKGVKADGSRVKEQMKAGEERQAARVSKKNRDFLRAPAKSSAAIDKFIKQSKGTIRKG